MKRPRNQFPARPAIDFEHLSTKGWEDDVMTAIKAQAVWERGYRMMPWWKRKLVDRGFTVFNDFEVIVVWPHPRIILYEP